MTYAIVEREENGETVCFLVPECWLESGSLYWPRTYTSVLAKNQTKPEKDWRTIHDYKILKHGIETYNQARVEEKKYEKFSNTESELEQKKKRGPKRDLKVPVDYNYMLTSPLPDDTIIIPVEGDILLPTYPPECMEITISPQSQIILDTPKCGFSSPAMRTTIRQINPAELTEVPCNSLARIENDNSCSKFDLPITSTEALQRFNGLCKNAIYVDQTMGYAKFTQHGNGIHLRQYSRAFIVLDNQTNKRIAFVTIDGGMVAHGLKLAVIERVQNEIPGKLYSIENVIISASHTHGTPGGYMMDLLYDLSTFGFVPETFDALVDGISKSIIRAHNSLSPGRITIGETEVLNVSVNRSPTSYLENPAEERAKYKYDTEKILTQLRFIDNGSNKLIGAINWYAIHPISMNNTCRKVTSDNVGYAAILLEKQMNPDDLTGQGKFVGTFASSNLGDVSPNIMGPKCALTGETCDLLLNPCDDGECFASGPGKNMYESTEIIAKRLFTGAMKILNDSPGKEVTGEIKFIHQFIDMPAATVDYFNPKTKKIEKATGCLPAMGKNFAPGTTDGNSDAELVDVIETDNLLWNSVRDLLAAETDAGKQCHAPKPILFATGIATEPYDWQPKIVATQIVQIGNIAIVSLPGEFTTMAGRRLKNIVQKSITQAGGPSNVQVILAGLANMYTSYITTTEEYLAQRYEAATTIYGPHTLNIYLEQYNRLATAMTKNRSIESGPNPPDFTDKLISLQPKVYMDSVPFFESFGDVINEPLSSYRIGDLVSVKFNSGNPRNNLQHEETYLTIERLNEDDEWIVIAVDSDWETSFEWERTSTLLGRSTIEVFWDIPERAQPGTYRIRHMGNYKSLFGSISSYIGESRSFEVMA